VPNLALIALGDSHHSQGGMKFATQISPLLNYLFYFGKQIFVPQCISNVILKMMPMCFHEPDIFGNQAVFHCLALLLAQLLDLLLAQLLAFSGR
jgi:hypothetical protein